MGTDKRERQKAGRQARIEAARAAQAKAEQRAKIIRFVVIAAVVVALIVGYGLIRRNDSTDVSATQGSTPGSTAVTPASVPPPEPGKTISGDTPCPAADGSSQRTTKFEKAPPMCIDPVKGYTAVFDTNKGVVKVKLDPAKMPNTTNNFVVLSRYHYYDGSSVFRIDPSIEILQAGSPTTNTAGDPGPGYTIKDEGGKFTYKEGQLVMARTPEPNSSGAQFFLTYGPKVSSLDTQGTYLLFGDVTEGLDVVKAIAGLYTPYGQDNTELASLGGGPKEQVTINKVTIEEA